MAGPLEGVRVVELTTMITGSLCGQMLADLGADIVKVERRDGGDMFRAWRGGTYSAQFTAYNRNKRSITADLQREEGREVVLRLAERADALVENFRPGVMDRLGLSLESLRARNPRLIYCSITGFGEDGPYEKRPAYDAVAQSLAGITSLFVDPEDPQIAGPTIADNMTGISAGYGILGALFERERGGAPRRIDVNMIDSAVWFIPDPFANLVLHGTLPGPLARVSASQSYGMACSDGKLLAVHLSSPEKFWLGVTAAFGLERLRDDPRFDERMRRIENYGELGAEFKKAARCRPRDHWMPRLEENDVPYAPINTLEEVFDDPQVKHLGTFAEVEAAGKGRQKFARRPVRYDGSRADQKLELAPLLGEHTGEILAELGYAPAEITAMRRHEIV